MADESLERLRRRLSSEPDNEELRRKLDQAVLRLDVTDVPNLERFEYLFNQRRMASQCECQGAFDGRYWYNTPGPFYCSETDNVYSGQICAPENLLFDHHEFEFVFRQPYSLSEEQGILQAANNDPFEGYYSDGNMHWTPSTVKQWWGRREELTEFARQLEELWARGPRAGEGWLVPEAYGVYRQFIENELEDYLRVYCFFLTHRRLPRYSDSIPRLDAY